MGQSRTVSSLYEGVARFCGRGLMLRQAQHEVILCGIPANKRFILNLSKTVRLILSLSKTVRLILSLSKTVRLILSLSKERRRAGGAKNAHAPRIGSPLSSLQAGDGSEA